MKTAILILLFIGTATAQSHATPEACPSPNVAPASDGSTLIRITRNGVTACFTISAAISASGDVFVANAKPRLTPVQREAPVEQQPKLAYVDLPDAIAAAVQESERGWVNAEKQVAASKAAKAAAAAAAVQAQADLAAQSVGPQSTTHH